MKKELGKFKGKNTEEALKNAAQQLNMPESELLYEVLEAGKSGFLGIGAVKAEILVYTEGTEQEAKAEEKKETVASENGNSDGARAVEFLKGLLDILHLDATPTLVKEDDKIEINLACEKSFDVIGKRGVMLDAIQNLAGAVANIGRDEYKRVVVDCDGYRAKRDAVLAHVAKKTAEKAVRLGRKVSLEPMSAYERRIIHATLADSTEVKTSSEGKEPRRFVVVIPNNLKPYEKRNDYRDRRGDRDDRRGEKKEFKKDFKKFRNYTEEEKAERSKVGGGTSTTTSERPAYKKSSSVVFGTFLGNSRKSEEPTENKEITESTENND